MIIKNSKAPKYKIKSYEQGHHLVYYTLEGRMVVLKSPKALRVLEMFANLALFLEDRLIENGYIKEKIIDSFGFIAFRDELGWHVLVDEERGNLFLFNYFKALRFLNDFHNYQTDFKFSVINIRGRASVNSIRAFQMCHIVLNAIIGCFTDAFVQRRDFSGYLDWMDKIRNLSSIYMYEIATFRHFFSVRAGIKGLNTLKFKYNLPLRFILTCKKEELSFEV